QTKTKSYNAIKITPAQTLLLLRSVMGVHSVLHSGVRGGSDGTSKLRHAAAPLGRHALGRAEDQDRQVVEEDGRLRKHQDSFFGRLPGTPLKVSDSRPS